MKKLYIAIFLFLFLVLVSVLVYFLGPTVSNLLKPENIQENTNNIIQNIDNDQPLTKEEQRDVLRELAPENPIDTQEEIDEQLRLLEQLQNDSSSNTDVNILNQPQGDVSIQEQLNKLEELQN